MGLVLGAVDLVRLGALVGGVALLEVQDGQHLAPQLLRGHQGHVLPLGGRGAGIWPGAEDDRDGPQHATRGGAQAPLVHGALVVGGA